MAIKIDGQSDNIKDFKVQLNGETGTRTVTLVRNGVNGPVLYARPGRLDFIQPGHSLPDHITSLAASRASALEPSALLGTLTDGGRIYHGDVINFTLTPEAYYTATYTSQSTVNFFNNTIVYGTVAVAPVTTAPLYRDLNFTLGDGVERINARDGSTTYSISSNQTLSVWQGYDWTFGAVRSTYWTNATVSPTSAAKGTATINITSSAIPYTRSFLYGATHTTSVTLTYYTDAINQTTTHPTNTVTYFTAWTGGSIEYSWTGATYYLPGSDSIDASEDIRAVNIQPQRKPSTVEITGNSHRTITVTGKDVNNSTLTHASSVATASWDDYWSGAKVDWTVDYEQYWTGVQISGSVAASEATRTINISAVRQLADVRVADWVYAYGVINFFIDGLDVNASPTSSGAIYGDITFSNQFWSGGELSYSGTPKEYWTMVTGTVAASTATRTLYPHADRDIGPVQITGTKPTGLNNLTLTGIDRTSRPTNYATYTVSSVGTLYGFWAGASVTWSASYAEGYTGTASGSVGASSSTRTINWPTPSLQAVYFYNNSGYAVIVGGTTVTSGSTYTHIFTSSEVVYISSLAAAGVSKYVTTSNYGTTYTIGTTTSSYLVDTLTKSPGRTSVTQTYNKPTYASGAAQSSSWSLEADGGTATITSHSGGPYGYDNITVKLQARVSDIAQVDITYSPVTKLTVS